MDFVKMIRERSPLLTCAPRVFCRLKKYGAAIEREEQSVVLRGVAYDCAAQRQLHVVMEMTPEDAEDFARALLGAAHLAKTS